MPKKTTHKLVNYSTLEVIHVDLTYQEWQDLTWSDGASMHYIITWEGVDYYDYGPVRKKSMQTAGCYPYASTALGVHPDDVQNRVEFDNAKGVPTEYDSDGDPIMRNKKHRRDYCRAHGVHDRNAGYSDPTQN